MPYEIIENEKYLTECEIRNFYIRRFGLFLSWNAKLWTSCRGNLGKFYFGMQAYCKQRENFKIL